MMVYLRCFCIHCLKCVGYCLTRVVNVRIWCVSQVFLCVLSGIVIVLDLRYHIQKKKTYTKQNKSNLFYLLMRYVSSSSSCAKSMSHCAALELMPLLKEDEEVIKINSIPRRSSQALLLGPLVLLSARCFV